LSFSFSFLLWAVFGVALQRRPDSIAGASYEAMGFRGGPDHTAATAAIQKNPAAARWPAGGQWLVPGRPLSVD